MRLVFAGTPRFSALALEALLEAGHMISLVLTQPDRPAGRGMRASEGAVKKVARERGLPCFQPISFREAGVIDRIAAEAPEVLVVAAYGLILPQTALDVAALGALNIHASLLPRWRGAAPVQRAILAGDHDTGITIMKMDAGLDTGPVLAQSRMPIRTDDTAGSLTDRLAELGATSIVSALADIEHGRKVLHPQPADGVTYAHKIDTMETHLDWGRSSSELERAVRAYNPAPGARMRLHGETIKIWSVSRIEQSGVPGQVLQSGSGGVVIACGEGALALRELQRSGGRRLAADDFLRGFPVAAGERLV